MKLTCESLVSSMVTYNERGMIIWRMIMKVQKARNPSHNGFTWNNNKNILKVHFLGAPTPISLNDGLSFNNNNNSAEDPDHFFRFSRKSGSRFSNKDKNKRPKLSRPQVVISFCCYLHKPVFTRSEIKILNPDPHFQNKKIHVTKTLELPTAYYRTNLNKNVKLFFRIFTDSEINYYYFLILHP